MTAALSAVFCSPACAVTVEPVGNFAEPTFVTSAPDDGGRLLVLERTGVVVEEHDGTTTLLADLRSLVICCKEERGAFSIAPAPDFSSSGRFYMTYSGTVAAGGEPGDFHLDSFRPDPEAPGELIREPILRVDHSLHEDHYGGQLQFGPDGYLYVSLGDGAGGGDPLGSGQGTETLLGKILRIEPRPGEEPPYLIPPGNPLAAGPGRDEVWSWGLRNPWRFSIDSAGDMIIGDVGQDTREEIDFAPAPASGAVGGAGANYGWSCREGFIAYSGAPAWCGPASDFVEPILDYLHDGVDGIHRCAVIAGHVARDPDLAELGGRYVYSDFCSGEIRSLLLPGSAGEVASDDRPSGLKVEWPVALGEGADGRLYVVSRLGGVYRLVPGDPPADPVGSSPAAPARPGAVAAKKEAPSPQVAPVPERLRLTAVPRWDADAFRITVSLSPCPGPTGRIVRLRRGGEPLAKKPLDAKCEARFDVTLRGRASFRALLSTLSEAPALRSPRLLLKPASRPPGVRGGAGG